MKARDILTTSFKNLFRQKARTILTIASMMVGAFLISIMLSIGNGLKSFMISQVTLFANKRTIGVQQEFDFSGSVGLGFGSGVQEYEEEEEAEQEEVPEEQVSQEEGTEGDVAIPSFLESSLLSLEDLEKIEKIDHVSEVTFETFVSPDYVRLDDEGSKKLVVTLYGVSTEIRDNLNYSVSDEELLKEKNALVLSDSFAEAWDEENSDLIGETVWAQVTQTGNSLNFSPVASSSGNVDPDAESKEFEFVIAAFFEKSIFSQIGFITPEASNEISAYTSEQSVEEYSKDEKAMELVVIVDDEKNVEAVDKAIEEEGYHSLTFDETIGQIGVVFDVISVALSSFGGIAMFVASIGIANTLLMAIYERTREIGVMKAVGATRLVIGGLFTAEAAWLGLFGGMLGLGVSWLLGRFANWLLHEGISVGSITLVKGYLSEYPTFDISVFSLGIVGLVLGITTAVAVIAGMYPAWRASRLDPIDALRHD